MDTHTNDYFMMDPKYAAGIIRRPEETVWTGNDNSFKVELPPDVSICNRERHSPCTVGWTMRDLCYKKFLRAINTAKLHEKCAELDRNRDPVISYRADYTIEYLCVKQATPEHHMTGKYCVWFCEIGHGGIKPEDVMSVMEQAGCIEIQEKYGIRIHHIFSMEIQLTKGNVSIGGCPQLIKRYKKICHAAVCTCGGNRNQEQLCHHWFLDSILGADQDIKTAHPSVALSHGRVTNFYHLFHTIVKVTDDVVFGGILSKLGLALRLINDASVHSNVGFTTVEDYRIVITINKVWCALPRLFAQTILHEIAHARVLGDTPNSIFGIDPHGSHWLQRMLHIKEHLAFRLSCDEMVHCARSIRGLIKCQDCQFTKGTFQLQNITKCTECSSKNVHVIANNRIYLKQQPSPRNESINKN